MCVKLFGHGTYPSVAGSDSDVAHGPTECHREARSPYVRSAAHWCRSSRDVHLLQVQKDVHMDLQHREEFLGAAHWCRSSREVHLLQVQKDVHMDQQHREEFLS